MKRKVRFAVMGCGQISTLHVQSILSLEQAELRGVFDIVPEAARRVGAQYGVLVYETSEALCTDPCVDAVCVCTPTGLHAEHALAAIAGGKHVLVEKPMALTLADCDAISASAQAQHVLVSVVSQMRFSNSIQQVKRMVEEEALGRIICADLCMRYYRSPAYYDSGDWRGTWAMDGGGALMNQGIHGVDLLQYIMGSVRSIYAQAGTFVHDIEVEDALSAVVRFDSGALGVIQAATCAYPGFPRRLEICGEHGSILLEEDRIVRCETKGKPIMEQDDASQSVQSHNDPLALSIHGHQAQIQDFINAILYQTPLLVDDREGRKTVEIILNAYASAASGMPVYITFL